MKNKLSKPPLTLVNEDNEYHVGKFLGTGAYADCYEVIHKDSSYAAKIISRKNISEKTRNYIEREISIHKKLKHINIISLIQVFEQKNEVVLIMELGPLKNLDHIIKEEYILSEKVTKQYLGGILEGIKYLHDREIIHRDIKPANILIAESPSENNPCETLIKICDFGMAISIDDNRKNICGTPNFIAPEILLRKDQTCAIDMWSLGCTIFLMTFGHAPFETDSVKNTYKRIIDGVYHFPRHILVGLYLLDLIENLLILDAYDRFTCEEAISHEFFIN